ncbi:DUF1254 domain-containing protein [Roseateles violae]|uniref:DUF1254 domain-containing protein n=1 Tax=Roseateles violae TaxID=3058042 RepID=A0ABT8DXI4_9BURK|nr:DUF1254 domain-containing protein [Pelomonas sp. PFR6]MDN3922170.1 DUF1254 domain-containing protein [Pelomonas sp. PFR6]
MIRSVLAALIAACISSAAAAQKPADDSVRRAIERRAVEAVVWGVPAVNFELMHDALVKAGGAPNQVVYWSRLPDWKNQTLTPNPDVIYLMPFYDTRQGPVVLEIPPAAGGNSITGSVDEGWQTAIEDVGPAGVDKGKGGKYLILPPDYKGTVPNGYIRMPSSTYSGYALLRSNIGSGSDADIAKAVAYGRKVKIYPLAQASRPPATKFVDASEAVYDSTIPYDQRFFETLHRFVQREPWIERDRVMIDLLKSIGIEKGKPFAPDTDTQALLKTAAAEARAWLEAQYEAAFVPPYFPSSRWAIPVSPEVLKGLGSNFGQRDSYPVSGRGVMYMFGFFSAKHLGQGQFYLLSIKDKAGQPLDGARSYRLTVPPKAPVKLYWSATAYDRDTHALIRDQKWSSRASTSQGLQKNADGSVDVFFGAQAPAGKESNWVPTRADGRFEVLFRLYGPEQPLFDKSWVLPDIEELK